MTSASILIVEDDNITREWLIQTVAIDSYFQVLPACTRLSEGKQSLNAHAPDLLLVDLDLPDGSGLDLIRHAAIHNPTTESLVLTVFEDKGNVLSAIQAGASGYLVKDGDAPAILAALYQVLSGGSPISPTIARHLLRHVRRPHSVSAEIPPKPSLLSPREVEVLKLIAKGLAYSEVADSLQMSPNTVTTHIKNIYRKLAVRSRGEAVFEATQMGLIKLNSRPQ